MHPMRSWRRIHLGACVIVLVLVATMSMPGCRVVRLFLPSDQIELASDDASPPSPIDSSSTRGLEVRLWVVDDTEYDAPRALADILSTEGESETSPIDPRAMTQWSDWGFRVIPVPIELIEEFLGSLRPVQPVNVQWLGEFAQWRAIVRAGELGSDRVRVGNRSAQIQRGRPRLIARSWIEPMLNETDIVPALRLDLGMQIETQSKKQGLELSGVNREQLIEDDGPVIDSLLLSAMLDGSTALVIVGEAPGFAWETLPEPIGDQTSPEDDESARSKPLGPAEPSDQVDNRGVQSKSDPSPNQTPFRQVSGAASTSGGPQAPLGKTLGELMLLGPGSRIPLANQTRVVPKRVIVVLIPRVEGGFRLLPRVQPPRGGIR
jgi:hypothetical protein